MPCAHAALTVPEFRYFFFFIFFRGFTTCGKGEDAGRCKMEHPEVRGGAVTPVGDSWGCSMESLGSVGPKGGRVGMATPVVAVGAQHPSPRPLLTS